jgi:hypothetical protein
MHVPGRMHRLHDQEAFPALLYLSEPSSNLTVHGNMPEPTQPRFEYCLALPAIAQTVPLHEANEHDQLSCPVSIYHVFL